MCVVRLAQGLKRYLLPGLVFQSLIIGGGYGSGRELVEFFLSYGPWSGLLSMLLVNTVIWSAVCAVSYELSRRWRAYDYRSFCRGLLGRAWGLYEVCYLAMMILILAVVAATAGSILDDALEVPYWAGVVGMMVIVGFLVFRGSSTIEGFFSIWSVLLYLTYGVTFLWCFSKFGQEMVEAFESSAFEIRALRGGLEYAAYNIGLAPSVLFAVRHIETRREAMVAGLLTGPIGIVPGMLFYLAAVSQYPTIVKETVPVTFLLKQLGSGWFQILFQIVLLGTLIETGTGLIHAFNERISRTFLERRSTMPSYLRSVVALGLLASAVVIARFGLIDLVAKGYGTVTWGFWLVFVLPVLSLGVWKVLIRRSNCE